MEHKYAINMHARIRKNFKKEFYSDEDTCHRDFCGRLRVYVSDKILSKIFRGIKISIFNAQNSLMEVEFENQTFWMLSFQ